MRKRYSQSIEEYIQELAYKIYDYITRTYLIDNPSLIKSSNNVVMTKKRLLVKSLHKVIEMLEQ